MTDATYRKTRRADEDLQEIYRYTRRARDRDQAVRYLHGLEQRFIALACNPLAGIARESIPFKLHHHPLFNIFRANVIALWNVGEPFTAREGKISAD